MRCISRTTFVNRFFVVICFRCAVDNRLSIYAAAVVVFGNSLGSLFPPALGPYIRGRRDRLVPVLLAGAYRYYGGTGTISSYTSGTIHMLR